MPAERWRQVEQLYHEALERPAADRPPWLAAACGADDALRDEVEALLRYDSSATGFLEVSALSVAAAELALGRPEGLVGQRLGDYEVLALLDAGGMGEVYRARDVRLQREVALKVFEHAATHGRLAAFEAEARAASALTHPNIVTIYGIGETGDTAFIAMELVDGQTLRDRLAEAPLTVRQVLDIALQLADAMTAAHARGIVHRDLKPENVMISTEGRVKVLDFGIATLQHEWRAAADAGAGQAPAPGGVLGTVGYLSPEQARGLPAVAASDQFAFGLICREMLTGQRLFAHLTRQAAVAVVAGPDPVPAPTLSEDAAPLWAVVARCLSKAADSRYSTWSDLLAALRRAGAAIERGEAPGRPGRRQLLALGALTVFGALSGAAAWRAWPRTPGRPSLAVLPFGNPARDEGTEYLCDGITESLIRQLARLPAVAVTARASAFSFKGSPLSPTAIGERLGAASVLTGSVTRRAGRVLIAAELIDTATGTRLWGADLDRPAADVLAVQHEIAQAILEEGLHLALTDDQRRLTEAPTDDPAAFELFLLAVHHLRLATEDDYLAARELSIRAVERAPRFALAWVTLASTYSVMAIDGYEAPRDAWPYSDRHVARALAIDPALSDVHAEAAAAAFFYRWDWREAERHWTDALRLRSEVQSELLTAYALQKWASGQPRAALDLARAARQVDPLNAQASLREGDLLAALGHLDEAVGAYERVVRDAPGDPRAQFGLAEARRRQGRFDEALAARQRAHAAAGDPSLDSLFAHARGAAGYEEIVRATARAELDRLRARGEAGGYVSALDVARAWAQLGEAARAFEYLAAAFAERAAGLVLLAVDPAWDRLRGDPRLAAAERRVDLRARTAMG